MHFIYFISLFLITTMALPTDGSEPAQLAKRQVSTIIQHTYTE